MNTSFSNEVCQALAALRSADSIQDVAILIVSLARKALDNPGPIVPRQLDGIALFQSKFFSGALDLIVTEPSAHKRVAFVFQAFINETPKEEWLAFVPAYVVVLSDFPGFAVARRFCLDGEDSLCSRGFIIYQSINVFHLFPCL